MLLKRQQADPLLYEKKEGNVFMSGQKKKGMTLEKKHNLTGWIFLTPAVALICWCSFYPMIQAFILSLQTGLGVNLKFGGFSNYARILKDPTFKNLLDNCNVIENIPVSSSFTTGKHNFLYKNKGNRLNNLGIYDGDYIIIDNNYKFEDSYLYLISLYNEFSCIRKIVKDNDDYKLYTGDDCISISGNNFEIIGKVIGLLKSFK